jgi:uncharacterized protein
VSAASCLYEGIVRHRRTEPSRSFEHRIALFYLDLDELPALLGGRFVARWPGLLRFRRRDYLGGGGAPLDRAVRDTVEGALGIRPGGPIRLLTQLRSFGHCFNPVSFYYCFDPAGEGLAAVVAEVTNTPWGERHAYVIPGRRADLPKALHVSPFMAMDHRYTVRASVPGERLAVHIESRRNGAPAFDATLALRRRDLTPGAAARVAARYPFANLRVLGLIYAHAVGLKLAGAPIHPRPRHPAREAV